MSAQQPYGNLPQGFGQQQGSSSGHGSPQQFGGYGGFGSGYGGYGGHGGHGGYGGHGGGYPGMFPPPPPHHQQPLPQPWQGMPYSGGYGNFYGLPFGGWSGQYAGQFGGPFASPGYGFGTPLSSSTRDFDSTF